MAFFVVAELNPTHQVALPSRVQENDVAVPTNYYRIVLEEDMRMRVLRLPDAKALCQPNTLGTLVKCISEHASGRFLITPMEKVTVQQLVQVLDVCEEEGLQCVASAE